MRYSRQELMVGRSGQKRLRKKTVAIVGIGAIGSVGAELMARAGIGKLILIDRDIVEIENLQRQIMYRESDVGKAKAKAAESHVKTMNSGVKVESYTMDLDFRNINLLKKADLVLDGTDNLDTRYLINEFCVKNDLAWIYAGAVKTKGFVFNVIPGGACFKCLLRNARAPGTCDTLGVLNTTTNIIASFQVNEALKILLRKKHEKNLIYIDLLNNSLHKIKVKKVNCSVCKGNYEYLSGDKEEIIKYCGAYSYQIKDKIRLKYIKNKLGKIGNIDDLGYAIRFEGMNIFKDRVLIKAKDKAKAKTLFSKYIGD